MGNIRKQSILSSLLIYVGFVFGAINSYLFAKNGYFQPGEYGLTQAFISINLIFFSLAAFGMPSVISRFYPYYHDDLEPKKNDLLSLAFVFAITGFILVCLGAIYFEPVVLRKFSEKSPLLVKYYYWILPFTFFYLVFALLDTHSAIHKKTVLPNFLRETGFRVIVTILIILYIFKYIDFDIFIKLFAFIYVLLAMILALVVSAALYPMPTCRKDSRLVAANLMMEPFKARGAAH